ncbi:MAG: Uma2 family endonuclease [Gemmatimonadales bacterium]|nr:MAG: Uma2 family endonuclease [Gemmatimonadales bacterium]
MQTTLTTRRFTVHEYYRMAEAGILAPGERVELIEGEIVQMAAIGSRHAGCVNRLTRLLMEASGNRAVVAIQNPVRLSQISEPEPDVAILRPRPDQYADAHPGPGEVLLIIEVADTTLDLDRGVKALLYAGAGIAEYWLVDLPGERVEVRREPGEEGYGEVTTHQRGEVLRPLGLPGAEVAVDAILP